MKQIDNSPRKPKDDELPDSFDRLESIENLKRDHLNVRNEDPSTKLIKDIRDMGFVNALITRKDPQNPNQYLVTDGWQRYQSACQIGFTHVPIDTFDSIKEATRYAESHSRGKAWDNVADYNQDFIRIRRAYMEEDGLSEEEAINKRTNERDVTRETIKINYEIAQLPKNIKQLLKDPSKREEGFHENNWKVNGCLSKKNGTLNKQNAHFIAQRYLNNDLSEDDAFKFALRSTKNSDMDVLRQALENYTYDNTNVQESFAKAKSEVADRRSSSQFNVGMINLPEEDKKILSRYISHEYQTPLRKYFNQLVQEKKDEMLDSINREKYLGDEWAFEDMSDRM